MKDFHWVFLDEETVVLREGKMSNAIYHRSVDQAEEANDSPATEKNSNSSVMEEINLQGTFAEVVGRLLKYILQDCRYTVQLKALVSYTSNDVEVIVDSLSHLLLHTKIEKVIVPVQLYNPIMAKCRAFLVKAVTGSLGLSDQMCVLGTEIQTKEIIDMRKFTSKLQAENLTPDIQTTINTLNNLGQQDISTGDMNSALSSAVLSAYKRFKKQRRKRQKEKVQLVRYQQDLDNADSNNSCSPERKDDPNGPDDDTSREVCSNEPSTSFSTHKTHDKSTGKPFIYQTQYPKCYACKLRFYRKNRIDSDNEGSIHGKLCQTCADINLKKRKQTSNLSGRYAVVTGGRLKIGYELALILLRDGATVIITTRFPNDAAKRFTEAQGFEDWKSRLFIYQLELRDLMGINKFVDYVQEKFPYLDILVNNAAQTIRRPVQFYKHLIEYETIPPDQLPAKYSSMLVQPGNLFSAVRTNEAKVYGKRKTSEFEDGPERKVYKTDKDIKAIRDQEGQVCGLHSSIHSSTLKDSGTVAKDTSNSTSSLVLSSSLSDYFPNGQLDKDGQQLDLRPTNSWREVLDNVPLPELMEVLMVNTVAPFILNQKLKPLMMKSPYDKKFIVNVSAMEGNFSRKSKTKYHPHTNMAKAALNMMTRTAALGYAEDNIYMTCVDTGWVTDERPFHQAKHEQETKGFQVPLDCVDGAARVYDPIVTGINGPDKPLFAVFLKNYNVYPW